ncbi:MAG TPA: adenosine kinase, partial [Alcanivorax sp.]|nr:adenosine kinase [Alcanivorax sp.]
SKGLMTLVDEARQQELVAALAGEAEPHKHTCGGSACNTVVAARHFGGRGYYACKVAADDTGDFFVRDLQAAGVDTNMTGTREDGVSGKCLVMITPDAERTMHTFLGISQSVGEQELDEDAIAASEFVYLEGYLVSSDSARAAAVRLRQLAEKHGVR